jgi:shikimate 5-dehydrogenase
MIGEVNSVYRKIEKLYGDNTEGKEFLKSLVTKTDKNPIVKKNDLNKKQSNY